jgi:hypothetical protein
MIQPNYPGLVNRVSTFRELGLCFAGMSVTLLRHVFAIMQNKFGVHVLQPRSLRACHVRKYSFRLS